ncbi:MAG: hypothetical protein Q7J51_07105 [Sheuella sp.]|nr:hypothetical protein [Sheuella sp.]
MAPVPKEDDDVPPFPPLPPLPPLMVGETSLETLSAAAASGTETALDPAVPGPPAVVIGVVVPLFPFDPFAPFDPMTEPVVSTDVDPEGNVQEETSVEMINGQSAAVAEKLSVPIPVNAMVCIVRSSRW